MSAFNQHLGELTEHFKEIESSETKLREKLEVVLCRAYRLQNRSNNSPFVPATRGEWNTLFFNPDLLDKKFVLSPDNVYIPTPASTKKAAAPVVGGGTGVAVTTTTTAITTKAATTTTTISTATASASTTAGDKTQKLKEVADLAAKESDRLIQEKNKKMKMDLATFEISTNNNVTQNNDQMQNIINGTIKPNIEILKAYEESIKTAKSKDNSKDNISFIRQEIDRYNDTNIENYNAFLNIEELFKSNTQEYEGILNSINLLISEYEKLKQNDTVIYLKLKKGEIEAKQTVNNEKSEKFIRYKNNLIQNYPTLNI